MSKNVYGGVFHARISALKKKLGTDGLKDILVEMRKGGYDGPSRIDDIKFKEKYPIEHIQIMNTAILKIYGPETLDSIAREAAKRKGVVGVFFRWAVSFDAVLKNAPKYWTEFYDFGTMETLSTDSGGIIKLHDAYVDTVSCRFITQYYAGVGSAINTDLIVEHTKCVGRGDEHCEWEITKTSCKEVSMADHTEPMGAQGTSSCHGSFSPREVRDAVLECFIEAQGDNELGTLMVKEQFRKAAVSFDDPTKEGLYKVIGNLAEIASSFRDKQTIYENYNKLTAMIDRCRDG